MRFVPVMEVKAEYVGSGCELVAEAICPFCGIWTLIARLHPSKTLVVHSGCFHTSHIVAMSELGGTEVAFGEHT